MSKIEFKTLEEATLAYNKLESEKGSLANELAEKKKDLDSKAEKIISLERELKDATEVANDAIQQINNGISNDTIVTINKLKYKVLFGVDGLSKEELSKDSEILKALVKVSSGALELIEG